MGLVDGNASHLVQAKQKPNNYESATRHNWNLKLKQQFRAVYFSLEYRKTNHVKNIKLHKRTLITTI